MPTERHGGCPCSACRFLMTGEPNSCYACHCTNCQSWSGSVCILTVVVAVQNLIITKGHPETGVVGTRTNRYCGSCARHLFSENSDYPEFRFVSGGLFDDTSWLEPCAHLWTKSAQPWIVFHEDARIYATQPKDHSELFGLWQPRV